MTAILITLGPAMIAISAFGAGITSTLAVVFLLRDRRRP